MLTTPTQLFSGRGFLRSAAKGLLEKHYWCFLSLEQFVECVDATPVSPVFSSESSNSRNKFRSWERPLFPTRGPVKAPVGKSEQI
jgi:hypothetical protein